MDTATAVRLAVAAAPHATVEQLAELALVLGPTVAAQPVRRKPAARRAAA